MYLKVMLTLLVILEAAVAASLWRAARASSGRAFYDEEEVAAGLNRRVSLSVTGVRRSAAISQLGESAGTRITIDDHAVEAAGLTWMFEDDVSLDLRDAPLSGLLGAMLPEEARYRTLPGGSLEVTDAATAAGDEVVRVYDLATVLDEWANVAPDTFRADGVEVIKQLIEDTVPDWSSRLPPGRLHLAGEVAVVTHVPEVHRRIERLLGGLPPDRRDTPLNGEP